MKKASPKATNKSDVETPLMKQYNSIKATYPDALLLFRVGDFYETFGEDAIKAASILGIVLTRRANGSASFIELAGFPYHSLDNYLPKLVRAGHRVAICDQLEDPKQTKTIVKRGVTELVTPGVSYNDKTLDNKSNNFLASVHFNAPNKNKADEIGVAFLDVSTGEFLVAQGNQAYIDKLLQNFSPSEVLCDKNNKHLFLDCFGDKYYLYCLDDWVFKPDFSNDILLKHFQVNSLKGFGINDLTFAIVAAGASLHYLAATAHEKTQHITSISRIEEDKYVWLDKFTVRNLELFNSTDSRAKSLIDIIDKTTSSMGSRMLKRWLALPLKNKIQIEERHSIVDYFLSRNESATNINANIEQIGDLERLISKVSTTRISPKELVQLKRALLAIIPIKAECEKAENASLQKIAEQLNPCKLAIEKLEKELMADPPFLIAKGGIINSGVNEELDTLRKIAFAGKDYLLKIQQKEIERTGINSLKIAYNNVFGYYLEVTNTHKEKVPADWIRKQTLANAERYVTQELKEYEEKILGAEEKILSIEARLFNELIISLTDYIVPVQLNASLIAKLDCLLSFSKLAQENNYTKPTITDTFILDIKDGRHPVIEKHLPIDQSYVANDIYLDNETQQLIVITGPNMAGKSALLRQTALIVLLAQIGSYVPAKFANIGIIDKIFTRVGASDNISSGESTFMVEMNETASIVNNLSSRSLILLDEIGRGTSTFDGISIAWSIAEFIHEHPTRAKTLFATHYHELNEMEKEFKRIKNYNVCVKEIDNKILFLRKLVAGGSEHSFGIHVAKMAGMPVKIIQKATEILKTLENSHIKDNITKIEKTIAKTSSAKDEFQLSFFQLNDPVLEQIKEEIEKTDINTLTPVEALFKLNEIKKLIGN